MEMAVGRAGATVRDPLETAGGSGKVPDPPRPQAPLAAPPRGWRRKPWEPMGCAMATSPAPYATRVCARGCAEESGCARRRTLAEASPPPPRRRHGHHHGHHHNPSQPPHAAPALRRHLTPSAPPALLQRAPPRPPTLPARGRRNPSALLGAEPPPAGRAPGGPMGADSPEGAPLRRWSILAHMPDLDRF